MTVLDTHTATDLQRYERALERLAKRSDNLATWQRNQSGADVERLASGYDWEASACRFAAARIRELLGDD